MTKTIITNIRTIAENQLGYLVVDAMGMIEKIAVGKPPAESDAMVVDGGGHLLVESFFDMRVSINNLSSVDSLEHWSKVLFAAGVTAAITVPSAKNLLDDSKSVRAFLSLTNSATNSATNFLSNSSSDSLANGGGQGILEDFAKIYCYGGMTRGLAGVQLNEYGLMGLAGALGFCDGNRNLTSSEIFLQVLRYAKNFDALVLAHPEDPTLSHDGAVMTSSLLASRLGLPATPAVSEALQLQRDITLVASVGGRYHAGPITTRHGVDIIRQAKAQAKSRGMKITADTAPHYFALNETAVGHYLTHAKLSPPLRSEDDRQAVIEGIMDGTIDIIASDHKPLHDDKKRLPFASATVGMASVETMLPLMMTLLHHQHKMPLNKLLTMITTRPRQLFELGNGGGDDVAAPHGLKIGQPADMVLLDEKMQWTINAAEFASPSKNTPFDGFKAKGQVLKTFKNGKVVFSTT